MNTLTFHSSSHNRDTCAITYRLPDGSLVVHVEHFPRDWTREVSGEWRRFARAYQPDEDSAAPPCDLAALPGSRVEWDFYTEDWSFVWSEPTFEAWLTGRGWSLESAETA